MTSRISAGSVNDIHMDSGHWMIVDIGFSTRDPKCGVWTLTGGFDSMTFAALQRRVIQEAEDAYPSRLNLLIEAPLSVAFNRHGNPSRRLCDEIVINNKPAHRDFYVNAGATTLIAADHFLRALLWSQRHGEVRLFEAHVSFKTKDNPSSEYEDVMKLKEIVCNPTTACIAHPHTVGSSGNSIHSRACIFSPEQLRKPQGDCVQCAFAFLNKHLVPPVIRINPPDAVVSR